MRGWRLLFAEREIMACRYSWKESWRVALEMETGLAPRPEIVPDDSNEFRELLHQPGHRLYRLSEGTFVRLRTRMVRNCIDIGNADGHIDSYAIFDRAATTDYRDFLKETYPTRFREEGVPQSFIGRLLKY